MPIRTTSQISLPQGCGFFMRTFCPTAKSATYALPLIGVANATAPLRAGNFNAFFVKLLSNSSTHITFCLRRLPQSAHKRYSARQIKAWVQGFCLTFRDYQRCGKQFFNEVTAKTQNKAGEYNDYQHGKNSCSPKKEQEETKIVPPLHETSSVATIPGSYHLPIFANYLYCLASRIVTISRKTSSISREPSTV